MRGGLRHQADLPEGFQRFDHRVETGSVTEPSHSLKQLPHRLHFQAAGLRRTPPDVPL